MTSSLPSCETVRFCCLSSPVCGPWLRQPQPVGIHTPFHPTANPLGSSKQPRFPHKRGSMLRPPPPGTACLDEHSNLLPGLPASTLTPSLPQSCILSTVIQLTHLRTKRNHTTLLLIPHQCPISPSAKPLDGQEGLQGLIPWHHSDLAAFHVLLTP